MSQIIVYLLPAVVFSFVYLVGLILIAALGRGPGRVVGALGCLGGLLTNGLMLLLVVLLIAGVMDMDRDTADILLILKVFLDAFSLILIIIGVVLTRAVKPPAPAARPAPANPVHPMYHP